jgi:hypothetical protein
MNNPTWFASPTTLEPRGLAIREDIFLPDADPDVIDQCVWM